MPRETNISTFSNKKKTDKKVDKKQNPQKYNKKSGKDSDSDSDKDFDDEEEEEMDRTEYHKMLHSLFPSKFMKDKVKSGEKVKEVIKKDLKKWDKRDESESESKSDTDDYVSCESNEESDTKLLMKKYCKKRIEKSKKTGKKKLEVSDEEESEEDSDLSEDESECEPINKKSGKNNKDKEKDKKLTKNKGKDKVSIIFAIGKGVRGKREKLWDKRDESEDEDEDSDEYDSEDEDSDYYDSDSDSDSEYRMMYDSDTTEDEDSSVSSVMTDDLDTDFSDSEDEREVKVRDEPKKKVTKSKKSKSSNSVSVTKKKEKTKSEEQMKTKEENSTSEEEKEDKGLLVKLSEIYKQYSSDSRVQQCMTIFNKETKKQEKKREKKLEKQKAKNKRIFRKIMYDRNTHNDYDVFEKMDCESQVKMIKDVKEINIVSRVTKPYRIQILETDIPIHFKGQALKKANTLKQMEPGSSEYYKMKNWIDTLLRIPFGKYKTLPVTFSDGVDKCHDFMEKAQKTLDDAVYGLNDAKMQIMQLLGQLITNPQATGTAIAIHGAMGTGKTSLVKEGISKILDRPFAFIALGGATDSSFLEGHSYTYEGSTWGKIVQIIIDSKCMNPVIYFDELDKISDTPKGEEIVGILTHLTDTSQNSLFQDKYFTDVNLDLSKCLFIFSYNDESKVNPILRDRMYRIKTAGYNKKEKTTISTNYLLPKISEQVNMKTEDIIIPSDTIEYIVDNYCNKEEGVRNLKRCLEIIYTKLNLYRLMKPGTNLFEKDMSIKVEFPFTVSKDIVQKLIKKEDHVNSVLYSLYV